MSGEAGDRTDEGRGLAARMADGLQERRDRHRLRSKPHRAAIVVAGFLLVIAGFGLSAPGVPGPGILVIAVGLAILALEFDWAERLLQRALAYTERAAERAAATTTRRKVTVALLAVGASAGAIAAVIAFEIPIPPW